MSADRILALKLIGDVSSIDKELKGTTGKIKGMAGAAKSWGRAWTASLAIGAVEKLGDALKDGIVGFREGERAASALSTTWANLGKDAGELPAIIDEIGKSALQLGTDDAEAMLAFNKALLATGGDGAQAMDRLKIAQDLVASGSAPSLTAALRLIQQAANGSKGVVDKFGLTSDTAAGRVRELGRSVRGAAKGAAAKDPLAVGLNAIGEAMETIAGVAIVPMLDGLGKVLQDPVVPSIQKLADLLKENPIAAQLIAIAAAVGILAAAAYAHPIIALAAAIAVLSIVAAVAVKDDWLGQLATKLADIRSRMEGGQETSDLERTLVHLNDFANTTFGPTMRPIFGEIGAAWKVSQGIINLDFDTFMEGLKELAQNGLDLALAPFQTFWETIKGGFALVGIDIGKLVSDAFSGLLQTIRNGIGTLRDIWNSIDVAIPPWNLDWAGVKVPNPMYGTIFDFAGTPEIELLPPGSFHVWDGTGDLFPDVGGRGKSPSQFGMYEKGLWNVPYDGLLAMLHQGESVVPADYADEMRRSGGMGGRGNTYNISVSAAAADPAAVGREVVRAIRAYEQRDGKAWRS